VVGKKLKAVELVTNVMSSENWLIGIPNLSTVGTNLAYAALEYRPIEALMARVVQSSIIQS